jgi:Serine carboxypeptidase
VGALESRLNMFDLYNEYTGRGNTPTWNDLIKVNWYDIRRLNRPYSRSRMKNFFNNNTIKSSLHVPQHIEFTTNDPIIFHFLKVFLRLCQSNLTRQADIMRSTAHLFPRLLSSLKVMLYQGYPPPSTPIYTGNSISEMVLHVRRNGSPLSPGPEWTPSKRLNDGYGMGKMVW